MLTQPPSEIWLVDLDPVLRDGANKRRPPVIVSNNRANWVTLRLERGLVTVVPVTSDTARVFAFQTLLPAGSGTGLRVRSKAQAEQVRSLSVERLTSAIGRLPENVMAQLDEALRLAT